VVTDIVPSADIPTPVPILTPPNTLPEADVKVYVVCVTLIVPFEILIPDPIFTPPNVLVVAVVNVYEVAVATLIVPFEILIPEPILTPPNVLVVAAVSEPEPISPDNVLNVNCLVLPFSTTKKTLLVSSDSANGKYVILVMFIVPLLGFQIRLLG
jgi:hypothetical protein